MNTEFLLPFLGWCAVYNIIFLAFWALMMMTMRGTIVRIHTRLLGVSEERVVFVHFLLIGYFKLTIIAFFVVPYLVLRMMS